MSFQTCPSCRRRVAPVLFQFAVPQPFDPHRPPNPAEKVHVDTVWACSEACAERLYKGIPFVRGWRLEESDRRFLASLRIDWR